MSGFWMDNLEPLIEEFKAGNKEPLDGDEVDSLITILYAKINLHEGNITEDECNHLLDNRNVNWKMVQRKKLPNLPKMTVLTMDEFVKKYKPIAFDSQNPESYLIDVHSDEAKVAGQFHIWTLIDGDDDEMWLVPGRHLVNRIEYVITEEVWNDDDRTNLSIKF